MYLSRRTFLKSLTLVALSTTVGAVAVQRLEGRLLDPLRMLRNQLLRPILEDAPPGPLIEPALQTLLAATETLAGTAVGRDHYQVYFRWRAENLRGYKALYERFMVTLNRMAQQTAQVDFVNCEKDVRSKILQKVFQVRKRRSGRVSSLQVGIFEKQWLLFDQFIVREIFLLFIRTDAWVVLGYESWPGIPRGLDKYTQAPQA